MSIQEMAELVITAASADVVELEEWSATENAAFEAYVNDYMAYVAPGCGKKDQ
jgi:hypothetical protein